MNIRPLTIRNWPEVSGWTFLAAAGLGFFAWFFTKLFREIRSAA